ncbi:MAG: hypothetical protein IK077_09910 [Thermoguttaceae bacterium]|nr:hypothetical protein [Thermoguttaceae bacterium]
MDLERIYWFCAIFGSAFVVVQFFTSAFLGHGGDDAIDLDTDGVGDVVDGDVNGVGDHDSMHHDSGGHMFLKLLSVRTATAGIAFFGLAGLACRGSNISEAAQLGIAIGCGFVAIVAVYYLMRALNSFNANGSLRTSAAIGAEGTVYLTIPAMRKGVGKVTIVQQERTVEYDASTESEFDLKPGMPIVVDKVLTPSLLLVSKR